MHVYIHVKSAALFPAKCGSVVTQFKMAGKTVADDISRFIDDFHQIRKELNFTKGIIHFKKLY